MPYKRWIITILCILCTLTLLYTILLYSTWIFVTVSSQLSLSLAQLHQKEWCASCPYDGSPLITDEIYCHVCYYYYFRT